MSLRDAVDDVDAALEELFLVIVALLEPLVAAISARLTKEPRMTTRPLHVTVYAVPGGRTVRPFAWGVVSGTAESYSPQSIATGRAFTARGARRAGERARARMHASDARLARRREAALRAQAEVSA